MTNASNTNGFFERGGVWVLMQFGLLTAVIVLTVLFHGDGTGLAGRTIGVALLLVGGVFGIAGMMVLGRNRTPFPQPHAVSELVERGIYGVVRHPLYTSVMLAALGWALIWQSWPALIAALALIPFFHAKARREERWLREKFPDYADYARRVPRFLPRLGQPRSVLTF
jgi:protein-S-isoprenylcysteine O-methyltransferase Ste14